MLKFVKRAFKSVNLNQFKKGSEPDKVFEYKLNCPEEDQHILRMMIKEPHSDFMIPKELEWCRDLIIACDNVQQENNIRHGYCYITVRHGIHRSTTEDIWHTDGYSEIITHIPEQNYIVTSNNCTEYINLPIVFPADFSALKHNIVSYINEEIDLLDEKTLNRKIKTALPNTVYVFDPYVIHRRPVDAFGIQRTFVRVTFVPIEIYDDKCAPNPLIDKSNRHYNRTAKYTRDGLQDYSRTKESK